MPRIQLSIPENPPLSTIQIPVRITDINYGNHLGNDSMVSMVHEARMQFLQQHQFTELNIGGISLIMSDLAVQFKNEAYYGDVLTIEIFVSNISRVSFQLIYKIRTTRNEKNLLIAVAATTMVGFNYTLKKVAPLTPGLTAILSI